MPFGWAAAATVVGAGISAYGANRAAGQQASAANRATDAQTQMFNQVQGNLAPYRGAGVGALNSLQYLLGIGGQGNYGSPGAQSVGYGGGQQSAPVAGQSLPSVMPNGSVNRLLQAGPSGASQAQQTAQQAPAGGLHQLYPGGPYVGPGGAQLSAAQYAAQNQQQPPQAPQQVPQGDQQQPSSGSSLADPGAAGGLGYGYLTHQFNTSDLQGNLAPNYNFQLNQGLGQAANAASMGGGLLGGNALQGMNAFAQNYAQNAYQQAFQNYTTNQNNIAGRLGSLAQLGQASATGSASGAPLFSQGISQTIQGAGQAQASGSVGMANALSSGLNNAGGYYYLNQRPADTSGPTGASAIQTFENNQPPAEGTGGYF